MLSMGMFAVSDFRKLLNGRVLRKQARRTGMAGPLGEMFDHGMGCCAFHLSQTLKIRYL